MKSLRFPAVRPACLRRLIRKPMTVLLAWQFFLQISAVSTGAYSLGTAVGDMRRLASLSGGTACPQLTRFDISAPGGINRQWSTDLGAGPVTILTASATPDGQLDEVETIIRESLGVWTNVPGTSLAPPSLGLLQRNPLADACSSSDGLNSICLDQNDPAFAFGVLAFTRVVSADTIGEQLSPATPPAQFVGQILDADVLVRPGDPSSTFATPAALASNPGAYDLETILTHELGHTFGFSHSGVWPAIMFPFAPPPGQFTGSRPTPQSPDAPLSDDDRTGLRVLYPDPADSVHIGSIRGRVLPANPLALPVSPAGVTGIFPAQVVAVDQASGWIAAAVVGGWSCSDPGPAQFDGSFALERLPVSAAQAYEIYAEPLDGPVVPGSVIENSTSICRNSSTDPEWPAQFACEVPAPAAPFSARVRPGP